MSMSPATATTARRRGTLRWFVALLATVLLVVSGSGLVAFAQNGAATSRSAEWVPAGTPILVFARIDMPGGQGEALAQVLTAFPGFADAASFEMKMDEALDSLFLEATDGAITWSGEIQRFFGGEIGLALPNVMDAALTGEDPDILVGIAITDRAAAESFVTLLTTGMADTLTQEPYSGSTIVSADDMALAVTDEWILLSQSADLVKASLDTLAGEAPSLADQESYASAAARIPAGHLAGAYMDLTSFADLIGLGLAATGQAGTDAIAQDLIEQLPQDMVAYIAAGPNTITVEAFITPSAQTQPMLVGETDLATQFPASTQLYIETRQLGAGIKTGLDQVFAAMPEEDLQGLAPFESMLGTDLASFLDFLGDTAIGASLGADGLWLGIVGDVTDETLATSRVERILSLVGILGADPESGISVETEDIAGTSVSTITLPIEGLTAEAGLPFSIGDSISLAVADGRLLLGTGDFVASSLALDDVDSLALSPGYADALGESTANSGVVYANIGNLMTAIDPLMSLMVPEWAEVQPWVTGLDRFVAVGGVDDDIISSRMTLYVNAQ
jgi:hypothetical protein